MVVKQGREENYKEESLFRGPNKSWHMNEYEKIKPYGFPIYFLPERKQYRDEGFAVSYAEINNILLHRDVVSESRAIQNVADNDLEKYFYYVVQVEQLKFPPTDWEKAKNVFLKIIESSGL